MSKRDTSISFQQILTYAKEAISLCEGKTRSDLDTDRILNLALVRLLEMIGEAANRIPEETREKYYFLPWLEIRGLRNRLIHGYDEIDFDILWNIVQKDLPGLIAKIERILHEF